MTTKKRLISMNVEQKLKNLSEMKKRRKTTNQRQMEPIPSSRIAVQLKPVLRNSRVAACL